MHGASLQLFTPCKGIQDGLEFWIPDRRFRILNLLSVELRFWILDSEFQSLAGFGIP